MKLQLVCCFFVALTFCEITENTPLLKPLIPLRPATRLDQVYLGLKFNGDKTKIPVKPMLLGTESLAAIPDSFDSREKWRNCKSISHIRDQSNCGSCWAFGAVEAMSDRICIHSKGAKQIELSAEDLLTCCDSCGYGCNGGDPYSAWLYYKNSGIVTGSTYHSGYGCRDYAFAPCSHHVVGKYPKCKGEFPTPKCVQKCQVGYNKTYTQDKQFASAVYRLPQNVGMIQREIMQNGPVEAAFQVYSDFPNYKSGVYRKKSDQLLGGHAIRILGWGVESGQKYWLIANSWNPTWGDKGYFKIVRGENHCGIESEVVAGLPRL